MTKRVLEQTLLLHSEQGRMCELSSVASWAAAYWEALFTSHDASAVESQCPAAASAVGSWSFIQRGIVG